MDQDIFQPTLYSEHNAKPITVKMIEEAVAKLKAIPQPAHYHFFVDNLPDIVPDEAIIEYYKDSGVIVVDRNGQGWLRGEPCKREI